MFFSSPAKRKKHQPLYKPKADFEIDAGRFLNQVQRRRRAQEGAIKAEVRDGLLQARDHMRANPRAVARDLKMLLENVKRAPDVDEDVRQQLRTQIVSALRDSQQREIEQDVRQKIELENLSAAREQQRIVDALARDQQKVKQILDQFNSLMEEGRYVLAEEAADEARRIAPQRSATTAASASAQLAGNYLRHYDARYGRL